MFQKYGILLLFAGVFLAAGSKKKWKALGPHKTPQPHSQFNGWSAHGLGRLFDIAVHPDKPKKIWVASPNGGLFFTKNRGREWKTIPLPCPGGVICLDLKKGKKNTQIVIGSNVSAPSKPSYSYGIFSTQNNGKTWDTIRQPNPYEYHLSPVRDVCILEDRLLYVIDDSLFSYQGGKERFLYKAAHRINKIRIAPQRSGWFLTGTGMSYSQDQGVSFTELKKKNSDQAFRAKNCDVAFGPNETLMISHDKGGNHYHTLGENLQIKHSYPLRVAIDASRSSVVYDTRHQRYLIGGVRLYQLKDGNSNQLTRPLYPEPAHVHDDIRDITFDRYGNTYLVHDAGVSVSEDGGKKWQNINGCGLNITEVYDMAVTDDNLLIGAQDLSNSILSRKKGEWTPTSQLYGDGGSCLILNDSWYMMRGTQMLLTRDKGKSYATSGFPHRVSSFNPELVYTGGNVFLGDKQLWKLTPKGWSNISKGIDKGYTISAMAIDEEQRHIILAKDDPVWRNDNLNGKLYYSSDGGLRWQDITAQFRPYAYRYITDLHFSQEKRGTVYACMGGFDNPKGDKNKVFMSTDYGKTWKNISFNLPNVPCHCIYYFPKIGLLLGTDAGMYILSGDSWYTFGTQLPRVPVLKMQFHDQLLFAATYGRGVWTFKTP